MQRSLFIALALAAGAAVAGERPPEPADPRVKVPPAGYRSAFEGYRPYAEEKLAPWRESNDAVKPKPPAKAPAKDGHGEHR